MREVISRWAQAATSWVGSGVASVLVVVVVVGWLVAGIVWGFSEKWHVWVHTVAALVTLVMVFVIQHTTNQESRAMLVKLDELLRVQEVPAARSWRWRRPIWRRWSEWTGRCTSTRTARPTPVSGVPCFAASPDHPLVCRAASEAPNAGTPPRGHTN